MDAAIRKKILELLDEHRIMTVATMRPDGWPQATTVGYVSQDLILYFVCGPDSQKAGNIARNDRVSLTIDHDESDIMKISGLSMAAHARIVEDPSKAAEILGLLPLKYPEQAFPGPMPGPSEVCVVELIPAVISVLDYSKGFGHTDLLTC